MQRAIETTYEVLQDESNVRVDLVIFNNSAFIDGEKRGVRFYFEYEDLEMIFTPEELRRASNFKLCSNGFGGVCDWCGSSCEDSVFLDMEFEFITLHQECYKHIQEQIAIYYTRFKSDIVSFTL